MTKVNVSDKLSQITEYWSPRIAGELNGQHVKLAKLKGEFVWHLHEKEDEFFYVIDGELTIEMRDKNVELKAGEFFIVPAGVEHRPVAKNEVSIMLFEPVTTVNTGNNEGDFTRNEIEWV